MAGCIANCDTLVFPSGVPPFPELEENVLLCYKIWHLEISLQGESISRVPGKWLAVLQTVSLSVFPVE